MARKRTSTRSKTSAKSPTRTTKAKGTTAKKAPAKKGAASKEKGTRERVFIKADDGYDQKACFALALSGGMWTLEEANDRYVRLVKSNKKVGKRSRDILVGDLSYMCGVGEVDVDGKAVEVYRSKNEEGTDVFGVPNLADALKKGSKAARISSSRGKKRFNGMVLVKKRKELAE